LSSALSSSLRFVHPIPLQPISPHTIWSFGDLLLKIENEPAGRNEDAPSPAMTLPEVVKNSFRDVIKIWVSESFECKV